MAILIFAVGAGVSVYEGWVHIERPEPLRDPGILIFAGRQGKAGQFDTPTPSYVSLDGQIAFRPFARYPGIELAITGQSRSIELTEI